MSSEAHSIPSAKKDRPFPWLCIECGKKDIVPVLTSYTANIKHDGRLHKVEIAAIEIPTCRSCGARVFSNREDEKISDVLRAQLHLLTPRQIRAAIESLGVTPEELAGRLGIAEEELSGWIRGTVIQSRAMDNLLRAYFASPEVRSGLLGPQQDPAFGAAVAVHAS